MIINVLTNCYLPMQKLKILELNSGKVYKTITKLKYTTRK